MTQGDKAKRLLSLHSGQKLLILPNVWNPIGARILEKQGFPAVATASAAISASMGFQDGEKIKKSTALDIIERIAKSVDVPVTADIEAGYGASISELEETVHQVVEAGVSGINIEDSLPGGTLRDIEQQCQRIGAIREAAVRGGFDLVINARIDSYFSPSFATKEEATGEAITRAKAYAEAGADCIYPMGPADEATVAFLRRSIKSPINILAMPNGSSLSTLERLGVNRVSFGPFIFRSCLRKFTDLTGTLLQKGDLSCFGDMMSRQEVGDYLMAARE